MPKTIRDELKHNTARSIKHLLTASENILENEEIFKEQHPELANDLQEILTFVLASVDGLSIFMLKAWGIDKDNIHKWY